VPTASNPPAEPRRVRVVPEGPILIEGPVEVELEDGSTMVYDRFTVALCACRRSRRFPLCDASHRRKLRRQPQSSDDLPAAQQFST
jgi:CDGSH-type Zn-finger protein